MELNSLQTKVVETLGPVVVKAGPGTGKTTTLVKRINEEFELFSTPCLVITFTQAGVTAFQQKLTSNASSLSAEGRECLANTAVSTFDSVINKYVVRPALSSMFPGTTFNFVPSYEVVASAWINAPGGQSKLLVEDFEFDGSYRGKKSDHVAVAEAPGFGDTVVTTYKRLFKKNIISPKVSRAIFSILLSGQPQWPLEFVEPSKMSELAKSLEDRFADITRRFPRIYIDEAQDSAASDYLLIDALAEHGAEVSFIGDPHQEIYRFRGSVGLGARSETATSLELTQNYRSQKNICEFLNSIYETGLHPGPRPDDSALEPVVTITTFDDENDYRRKLSSQHISSPWVVLSHQENTSKRLLGQPISYGQKSDPVYDFAEALASHQHSSTNVRYALKTARKLVDRLENRTELIQRSENIGLGETNLEPSDAIARLLVSKLSKSGADQISPRMGRSQVVSAIESAVFQILGIQPVVPPLPARRHYARPSFAEEQWKTARPDVTVFDIGNSGTIHSAKGLEFENVSVVIGNWKPNDQPHLMELLSGGPIDYKYKEIVNVFYVGCSRAIRSLNVSFETGNQAPPELKTLVRAKWGGNPSFKIL